MCFSGFHRVGAELFFLNGSGWVFNTNVSIFKMLPVGHPLKNGKLTDDKSLGCCGLYLLYPCEGGEPSELQKAGPCLPQCLGGGRAADAWGSFHFHSTASSGAYPQADSAISLFKFLHLHRSGSRTRQLSPL